MRTLYNLFALLVTLLLCSATIGQMRQVYKDPTTPDNQILKSSFYSNSTGYVAFRDWVGFTTDSGRTFTKKHITNSNVDFNGHSVNLTFGFGIEGVQAFNIDTLIVYGDYGFIPAILYSVNGGSSFKLVYHSQYNPFAIRTGIMDMEFPENNNTGYAVDCDRVLKTTNRGLTWTPVLQFADSYFDNVEAVNNSTIFVYSTDWTASGMVKTTTGGANWQVVNLPANQKMVSASFLNANTGWISTRTVNGNYGKIYYTSNGGGAWIHKNPVQAHSISLSKMQFVNDSTGYGISGLFSVWKTSDSGRVWERFLNDPEVSYLYYSHNALQVRNSQLWAGGGHGILQINTDLSSFTRPSAGFVVDTQQVYATNTVKLVNHSRQGYACQWLLNDAPLSNAFHASYTRNIFKLRDTITLVVNKAGYTDTTIQYQDFHPPVMLYSFTPTEGVTGTQVIIKGWSFQNASSVYIGGVSSSFTVLSDTTIRAIVGTGASGAITVVTPIGTASKDGFVYHAPPVISGFSPTTAATGSTVTITGTNFINISSVSFGGVAAASFVVNSPTSITAITGNGGSGVISIQGSYGTASINGFGMLPTISSFSPSTGTIGTHITIMGSGFGGATSVSVGGTPVSSFTVMGHTTIKAIVGGATSGDIVVSNPYGSFSLGMFTYLEKPRITGLSPLTGTIGSTVLITGDNFLPSPGANTVYFGGAKAIVNSASANQLSVTVPYGSGYKPVSVTTNHLSAFSQKPFHVIFPNGGAISPTSFASYTDLLPPVNYIPAETATADVDGDGKLDIIATVRGATTAMYVYRNTSTGSVYSFDPPVAYPVANLDGIALSDLDGDGKLDMVAMNGDSATLAVYRNLSIPGNISFEARKTFPVIKGDQKIQFIDLDLDGKPDLVFTSRFNNATIIYRNISNPGDIGFATPYSLPYRSSTGSIGHGDLDDDGKPELIFTGDSVMIFRNQSTRGNLIFTGAGNTGLSYSRSSCVTLADLDNDGRQDIVTSDVNGGTISVFRSTSSAGSISFAAPKKFACTNDPFNLAAKDLDGDGKIDIAVTTTNHLVVAFKNISSSATIILAPKSDYLAGNFQGWGHLEIADLDNDSKPELVVISESRRAVTIFKNEVKAEPFIENFSPRIGETGTPITINGTNFNNITSVTIGGVSAASFTVNSSSQIIAVVGAGASGAITVVSNIGAASQPGFLFGYPPVITGFSPAAGQPGSTVTITGTNFGSSPADNIVYFGAMKASIISASPVSLAVTVPPGATFQKITVTCRNLTAHSDRPFSVTFAGSGNTFTKHSFDLRSLDYTDRGNSFGALHDLDGDGKLEIIAGVYNGLLLSENISSPATISFAPVMNISTGNHRVRWRSVGDLDGDAKPDIVSITGDYAIAIHRNISSPGNLAFEAKVEYNTGPSRTSPSSVAIADLDGDGRNELVVANYYSRNITYFRNTGTPGNISLTERVDLMLEGYPTDLDVYDMNNDGKADIVASVNGNGLVIIPNNSVPGSISLGLEQYWPAGSWPHGVVIGDLDNDGYKDVVIPNVNGNSFTIFKNGSTGSNFSFTSTTVNLQHTPRDVNMADLDGDGKLELMVVKKRNTNFGNDFYDCAVYKNLSIPGNIEFATKIDFDGKTNAWTSRAGDLNGDGRPEMIIFGEGGRATVYKNLISPIQTIDVCTGSTHNLESNFTGTTFQWQMKTATGHSNLSNNSVFSGVNSSSLTITNVPAGWTNYTFRCIVNGGTDTSNSYSLRVLSPPLADAGPDVIMCATGYALLGTPALPGLNYNWTSSDGHQSFLANPALATYYNTSFYLAVNNGACWSYDTVKVIFNASVPPTVGILPGSTNVCPGQSVTFTGVAGVGGFITYEWMVNGIVSHSGSNTFTTGSLVNGDRVRLRITSSTCPGGPGISAESIITVSNPVANAGPDLTYCIGSSIMLGSPPVSGNSYAWTPAAGLNDSTFAQPIATPLSNTNYILTVKNIVGGCSSKDTVQVNVQPIPPAPVLSQSGNTLTASGTGPFQWYLYGNPIAGATGNQYQPSAAGQYMVAAIVNGCQSPFSNVVQFVVTALNSPGFERKFTIGPIPMTNSLYVTTSDPAFMEVMILDMLGRQLTRPVRFSKEIRLNTEKLSAGAYIICIKNTRTGNFMQKLIVK